MYNPPQIIFRDANDILYELTIPTNPVVEYYQKIIEVPIIIFNESLDGRLRSNYRGLKYEIEIEAKYFSEDDYTNWYNFNTLKNHLLTGATCDYYPHGVSGAKPLNYYRGYLNCIAKEPRHENARIENISKRWGIKFVLCTNEYI